MVLIGPGLVLRVPTDVVTYVYDAYLTNENSIEQE